MSALDLVLDRLRERDCRPRGSGRQWSACCPGHDDRNPSLSVTEGADGVVLVRCHTGCPQEHIVNALDLAFADLAPVVRPLRPTPEPDRPRWVEAGTLSAYADAAHEALLHSPDAGLARRYLRHRHVDGDLVRHYRLGFGIPHEHPALASLRNRIVIVTWPHGAEGRVVPGLEAVTYRPERKWHTAAGSTKRAWRTREVDCTSPVVAVEGVFDVLGLDRMAPGQAIALRGKRIDEADARDLARRGLSELLVCLDADADAEDWRRVLATCAKAGLPATPVLGPDSGDWGDLLDLTDDTYFPAASEALCVPVRGGCP